MEKIVIRRHIKTLFGSFISGEIDVVCQRLTDIKKEYLCNGFTHVELVYHEEYDYTEIQVWGNKLESDAEFKERKRNKAREALRENRAKQGRREQYEKLKEEFEKIGPTK